MQLTHAGKPEFSHTPAPSQTQGGFPQPAPIVQASSVCPEGTNSSPQPLSHVGSKHLLSRQTGSIASAGQLSPTLQVPSGQGGATQLITLAVG